MENKQIDFGFIKSNHLYRKVTGNEVGLELSSLDDDVDDKIHFFREEFEKFSDEYKKLNEQIASTENKGSFLVKLQNIKSQLSTHRGLGDYDAIETQIINQENLIKDLIAKNRSRNTDIKRALMLELNEVLKNNDFYEVGQAIKDIKHRWIKTGSANDDVREQLETEFTTKTQAFFDKRKAFFEDKKKLQASKIKKYQTVIDQLNGINKKKKLKNEIDAVKTLQAEWKSLGSIPEKDYKPLNAEYWKACKLFFDSLKEENREENSLSKETLITNLNLKKELVEALKSIDQKAISENVNKGFNELKGKWKNVGKTQKKDGEPIHHLYYELTSSIMEKQFIYNLASKKFKSFAQDDLEKKTYLLRKLTKDLLARDKSDLATFQENMDKMHVNKGSFVDMLEGKLKQYQRKVELKTKILNSLKQ